MSALQSNASILFDFGLFRSLHFLGPTSHLCRIQEYKSTHQQVHQNYGLNQIKWKHWIEAQTSIPSFGTEDGIPGLYEGALYYNYGMYRPTFNSKMRSLGSPFESVNTEQLVLKMYNRVSPIDSSSSSDENIYIKAASQHVFNVITVQPMTHNLTIEWFLNDELIGGSDELALLGTLLNPGTKNTLKLKVTDPSSFVRDDPANLLIDTKTWDIYLLEEPVLNTIGDKAATVGQLLQFDVSATHVKALTFNARLTNGSPITNIGASLNKLDDKTATFSWMPSAGQAGQDYFIIFTATTDLSGLSDSEMIRITVENISPKMIDPAKDTTLTSSEVPFTWSTGSNVDMYWLYMGTQGPGSYDIYNQSQGLNTTATISGIPQNGEVIYVRLWSRINGRWNLEDTTYLTQIANIPVKMINPKDGSYLNSSMETFNWSAGTGVSQYWLYMGTQGPGSNNVYSRSQGLSTTATISGIPQNGAVIYVRLWSYIKGRWTYQDYTYNN